MKTHIDGLLILTPIALALTIGLWSIVTGGATFDPSFLSPSSPAETTNR